MSTLTRKLSSAAFALALMLLGTPVMAQKSGENASQQWVGDTGIVDRPRLTVLVEPQAAKLGTVYLQGQIKLRVQMLSPTPYEALKLDLPDIEGARVLTLTKPHTRDAHFYGHAGFAYETRLAIFPQKSGELVIPPIRVSGAVSTEEGERVTFDERWDGMNINVKPVDPSLQSVWWMVAEQVSLEESWTPAPEEFRVGDTVQRHIVLTVHGATREHLPTLDQGQNEGYAVVGTSRETRTELTPQGAIATLKQTWDIRIQSPQVFFISPLRVDYWDAEADQAAVASLAAQRIEPLLQDVEASRKRLIDDALAMHRRQRVGVYVLIGLVALVFLTLLLITVYKALPTRADRKLKVACKNAATSQACFAALTDWSHESFGYRGGAAVPRLRATLGTQRTQPVEQLQSALFSANPSGEPPSDLASVMLSAARRLRLRAFWRDCSSGLGRLLLAPQR